MLTENSQSLKQLKSNFNNPQQFIVKIKELYNSEINEIIDQILIKQEEEFMRMLTNRVQSLLAQDYTEDIDDYLNLTTLFQSIEKEVYASLYKKVKMSLNDLLNKTYLIDITNWSFRKHCNYQSEKMIHLCLDGKTAFSFLCNGKYVACRRCSLVYRLSCVKLYCDFCSIEYYTLLSKDSTKLTNYNIQPATWDKYHCNIVFNDQMQCIQCKDKLSLNTKENTLLCLKCNFQSNPNAILWKCVICSAEFRSGAKIYNPLEYKMFKNTIKEAIVKNKYARPERVPCGHGNTSDAMPHKSDCEGKLLIGYYHDSKMIVCDKCNIVTLYDKFIWTCPICNRRFREMNSAKKIPTYINVDESFSSYFSTNESGTTIDKMNSINLKGSTIEEKESVIEKKPEKLSLKYNMQQIISLPQMNLSYKIPYINLDDYMVISEIAEGTISTVFAVKDNNNEFYALKKQPSTKALIEKRKWHYAIKSNEVVHLKGIAIDKEENELNILLELGLCDLEKEIVSRKRLKRFYSEHELVNILLQLASALSYLQINGYVHWNICPGNIIMFKDDQYKLCSFSSLRKVSDNKWDRKDNYFTPPQNQTTDMIKADSYCLGLTMVYLSTLSYLSVEDIISIDFRTNDDYTINSQIKTIIHNNLSKNRYSEQYEELILSILNANVNARNDFVNVLNFITNNYYSRCNYTYSK